MLQDPDLEKLAVESRQRLVQEFAETHADLRERSRRIPSSEAQQLAENLSCPFQIATLAYIIDMDGILSAREAVNLLSTELERLAVVGEEVPNLPGNVMEFALAEGRWIEYIHGKFIRELELKVRELANLEGFLEDDSPAVEKAVALIWSRSKVAETFIAPLVEAWLNEHKKSTSEDMLMAFGPAITKWKKSTLKGKLSHIQRRSQAFFRKLSMILSSDTSESATVDLSTKRLNELVEALGKPLEEMSIKATSHLLVHIAPRRIGRGDKSAYVAVSAASTRGNKAEPDLSSPFDFLERDVLLAKRRPEEDRKEFLTDRIGRVIRYLKHQGTTASEGVERALKELEDRLNLEDVPLEDLIDRYQAEITGVPVDRQNEAAVKQILDYIIIYAYGEEPE
ncbi:MAG: hypothetical protein ACXADC_06510 [Candidatus Thorarchaeota archaeon]